jgi:hypothetical protein
MKNFKLFCVNSTELQNIEFLNCCRLEVLRHSAFYSWSVFSDMFQEFPSPFVSSQEHALA